MASRPIALGFVAVLIAGLAACVTQVEAPPEVAKAGPADFPAAYYERLVAQGKPVFRIDPARSLVVIEVRRSGSLARFGHDHVVASHDLGGYIAPGEGRADLYVPLDALVVDEPALRAEAGFDTQPSPADIAGTRSNMLEKVLDTERYPHALIAAKESMSAGGVQQIRVDITLHGITRTVEAAARFESATGEVSVTGAVGIDQSQFGIVPFSILGGAIAVQDHTNISYRIQARRVEGAASNPSASRGVHDEP